MILERAKIVTLDQLTSSRRYAIVACGAVSAVLTPPDAVSMLMLMVPLYALYEFAIVAIRLTHWRSSRAAAELPGDQSRMGSPRKNRGPKAPPGGRGLAVSGPFKRIARAGGQKVTIRTA